MSPTPASVPPLRPPPAWAAVLDACSDLMALLDAQGRILWVNAGFSRATGHAAVDVLGRPAASLLADGAGWGVVEERLRAGQGFEPVELAWRPRAGQTRFAQASGRLLDEGEGMGKARVLLALHDTTQVRQLKAEAARNAELLEMAREFGRLGIWERTLPSSKGRWDSNMFRLFELPPGEDAPPFELVEQRLHPGDRLGSVYADSTRAAGKYTHRYRIQLPHGRVRRVHSQWEVKCGPDGVPDRAIGLVLDDTEAYRLADALTQANAQLKIAVELGNIAVWRHHIASNRIFYNDHTLKLLGLRPSPEGLPVDEVRSLIHPDDIEGVVQASAQALKTHQPVDVEARYRRTDGSWAYVLTRRVVHRDEEGQPIEFVGVGLDVTEQAEKLRRASELAKNLEIAVSAANVGVWSRDPKSTRATWNEQMFRITGRPVALGGPTRDEWIYQIVHPDDRAAILKARAEVSADTMAVEHECRIVRPDGEVRWLVNRARREMRDGVLMVFGVTLDVTERALAEVALRSVNERIALAARSAGVGTWELNVATGEAVWDEAMFRLRGMTPQSQALSAAQRLATTHPEDVEAVESELREAAANAGPTAHEFRVVWPDGTVRWIASRSTPMQDARGALTRRIGVNWDITEAKNSEISRREREVALRESKSKSEFLSRMSHELRTPLNAILGFAQLLKLEAAQLDSQQQMKVDHIQSAGEHLLALIDDVLDLSRLESEQLKLDLQPVAVKEILAETLPLVHALAQSRQVALNSGPLEGVLQGDRIRLRQMMLNLLTNAVKYNRRGGEVEVSSLVDGASVVVRVRDTGRGMTAEQIAHLFEPFNRLGLEREGIEGTGIGLAVVKTLVERMGGRIAVRSRPREGSVFEVSLPRASVAAGGDSSAIGAPSGGQQPAEAAHPHTLLYIEDNPVNVLLVQELIRMRPGLRLESAGTGVSGVARAGELRPDLILVDIQLPDIDGFEVLHRLRQQTPTAQTPCIALSANALPEDIARATAAGFSDYWTKPIDFSNFLAALDRRFPKR